MSSFPTTTATPPAPRCATSTRSCSSPAPTGSCRTAALALLECAGERGEAEAIGGEIARLLADGVEPDEIAVVAATPRRARAASTGRCSTASGSRSRSRRGAALATPPSAGRSIALARCRRSDGDGRGPAGFTASAARGWSTGDRRLAGAAGFAATQLRTAEEAVAGWKGPPASSPGFATRARRRGWLRALAAAAHELAEEAHAGREPVAGQAAPEPATAVRAARGPGGGRGRVDAGGARRPGGCPARGPTRPRRRSWRSRTLRVPLWRGPDRGPGAGPEPLPGAGRARPPPVRGLASGRRVPRRPGRRPAARRRAARRLEIPALSRAATPRTRSATCSTPASRAPPSACGSRGEAPTRRAARRRARRSSTTCSTCSPPDAEEAEDAH